MKSNFNLASDHNVLSQRDGSLFLLLKKKKQVYFQLKH